MSDTQISGGEVLRAFHSDAPYLFLGAAFTTIGIVSAAFSFLRRRFDPLLLSLAAFATLYGQRLWLDADIFSITSPRSAFLDEVRAAVDFLVPIPAFVFFHVAGFLGRGSKFVIGVLCFLFLALVGAAFTVGHLGLLYTINNTLVVLALLGMVAASWRWGTRDRDSSIVRAGLLCFAAFALWDNLFNANILGMKIESYGFAIFLACLGYVAARRVIERDVELGEIQKELDLARSIQLSILPGSFPASNDFHVAARYIPMNSVAGDLYDFLVAADRRAGLLIADVSGHGVGAALIASMVKMAASSQRALADHPAQLLAGMNAALCGNTQGQFVTAAYVHLDARGRQLRYAAAGHPAMLMLRNGIVTEIAQNGLLLAATPDAAYSDRTLSIEPGDRLLLYTDGLVEARNDKGELFGEELLMSALRNTAHLEPGDAADRIIAAVTEWAQSQDDDLTVLVCDFVAAG